VSVQLVDVTNGFQLWSERYDRQDEDVFEIEDQIAASVVDTLKVTLVNTPGSQFAAKRTTNLEAYKLYLRGRHAWAHVGPGIERSLDLFEQALEIDPEFALAHAGVADVYIAAGIFETMPPSEAFPLAHLAADRARTLDPSLSEAHASLGAIALFHDWNFTLAREELEKAVSFNPSNVSAYNWLALYHAFRGDTNTALDWARRGVKIDPLAAPTSYGELFTLFVARRYEDVVECADRVLSLNPSYSEGYRCLGASLLALGRTGPAIDALRQAVKVGGASAWAVANLAMALAFIGNTDEAERLLASLEQRARSEWISKMTLGVVYAALGRSDDAITAISRSIDDRDCWVVALGVEPAYDSLRGNPRFEALVERVGIARVPTPAGAIISGKNRISA
jgi:serine/threonine-protein kinase